jgi:hypothetical protein
MKRWWILLLTFGVVFALAVPVAAKPGGPDCERHPNHPTCPGDPASEEPDPTWGTPCEEEDRFRGSQRWEDHNRSSHREHYSNRPDRRQSRSPKQPGHPNTPPITGWEG